MKTWYISTWGGGTPEYLVTAESKERAWKLVQQKWNRDGLSGRVGSDYYRRSEGQTIDHLKEVEGFYGEEEKVVDLRKL